MAAAYGGGCPRDDYGRWFGYWLNLDRVEARRSVTFASGVGVALSPGPLERWVFDAVALTPEEADAMEFKANAKRRFEEARAQAGFHPS